MENCFVKKLNGAVNDNSLLRYNEVRVKFTISQQINMAFGTIGGGSEFEVSILSDDGYFVEGNTKTTTISSSYTTKAVGAASYPCELILSYYDRKNVGIIGGIFYNEVNIINTMTNLSQLSIQGFVDEPDSLNLTDLTGISVDTLEALTLPQSLNIMSLSTLNRWYKIRSLTISKIISSEAAITLESILNAWHTAGRVSGSVTINSFNQTCISYNGAILYGTKTFDFTAGGWTERT